MFKAATVETQRAFSLETGWEMGESIKEKLGCTPSACWLFCAPLEGFEALLKGILDRVGTDRLVGCTTDGEISCAGFGTHSAVLGAIATDQIEFELGVVEGIERDSEAAARRFAEGFSNTPQHLHIFSDGLTGNGCAILRGISQALGSVPVSGGTAADLGKFHRTYQFIGDRVYSDALCGIGFYGNFHLGTGVRNGWVPIGVAKTVTRAKGNVVYELNGEPALNVYERFLGRHAQKLPVIGVEYPLGLLASDGDGDEGVYLLRATISVDRKERSIRFAGEIPEGVTVNLTCGDSDSILDAADNAAQSAMGELGDTAPGIVFCYSCMARKLVLGRRTWEEIERIRERIGSTVPIIGFYSYGEYCRIRAGGPNYLHNETITVNLIGA